MSQSQAAPALEYHVGDQPVPGYTLVRELGRGAMGVVWLAQTDSGFERALKIISLQQRGGKKEYRGLRTIKQRKLLHGNLLTLIDYWLKDRDGRFIPDNDELDTTDSFFAPTKDTPQPPGKLSATAQQSLDATNAAPPKPNRGAVTRVAGTLVGVGPETPTGGLDKTLDQAQSPRPTGQRPVQLIVAMELGHKTLDDRQKQCQEDRLAGIPSEELLDYMEQAARGLDYLHREGIVHRDIKPQNIMLVGDVAKVCDYGLVVTTDADLRATSNAFTPLYASPEAVAEKPLTGQSDQYSLAITYVELRTGHTPYASETAASVYSAKDTGKYELSRIRSSAVRAVLKRALAKSPNDRFGSCTAFIRELEKAELSKSGLLLGLAAAAALVVIGAGLALGVPEVRTRLFPAAAAPRNGDSLVTNSARPNTSAPVRPADDEPPVTPLPPPPPEQKKVVSDARELRLAGKLTEAAAKLDDLKIERDSADLSHWPYLLERLHLDLAGQSESAEAVADNRWEEWRQRAEQLSQRSRGQGAEQAELAAIKVFTATRLDPALLELTPPLADDLARAIGGKEHWNLVLSKPEQARLESLQKAAADRVARSREALPAAWKKRLAEIWPAPTAAQLLIDRVQAAIRDKDAAGLAVAGGDLDEVARQSGWDSLPAVRPQLLETRADIKQAQKSQLVKSLTTHLTNDEFLVDSEARKRLLDEVHSLDGSELALAPLLRIEAEMAEADASGKGYSAESVDELRDLVGRLSGAGDLAPKDWFAYARFLFVRAEVKSQRGGLRATPLTSQADALLSWPETAASDWHTPRRKAQAADALIAIADAAIPFTEKDAVRFHDLPRDWAAQATLATSYLEKAQRLGSTAPDLSGLLALALSIPSHPADGADVWTKIGQNADRALAAWASGGDQARQGRLAAVQYVGAVAASRLREASASARNRQAIATLASLLKQSFRDEAQRNANADRGVLENLVLPGLAVPLPEANSPVEDLAALWAAKGRIIERNPSPTFLAIEGINPVEQADDYARALLTAHAAYAQALTLHTSPVYAAGSARTLLKLPREVFDWQKYEVELAHLVRAHTQEARTEPSLLLADACVLRRRALVAAQRAEKLKLLEQAVDRFGRVDAATRNADPYAIRGVALCAASDTFLKAAFWTPIAASDEAKAAGGSRTKYAFLRQALDNASAAQSDTNLLLPEEARTAKGNSLEDMAFYYKETDNYPSAVAAFQESIDQTGRRRSKAYALMSLGRCQYRWAIDAARIDGDPDARVKHLREAYQSLSDAAAHARSTDPSVAPEAGFWLATVIWESALEGPGNLDAAHEEAAREDAARGFRNGSLARLRSALEDPSRKAEAAKELAERFSQMERARQAIVQAASDARSHSPIEWAHYLPTAAFLGKKLTDELTAVQASVTTNLVPANIVVEVRKQVDELLTLAEQQPAALSARERRSLVDLLVRIQTQAETPQKAPQLAAQLYQSHEKLFTDDNDDSRAQLVLLKLIRASAGGTGDYSEAEQLAARIGNSQLANWARGYCERFKADALLRPYRERLRAYLRDPEMSKSLALADDPKLQAIQEAYATALTRFNQATDPKTLENLDRLCAAPLDEVESGKWQASLTNLEADLLRQNIEETEKLIRGQLYELLDARIFLHRAEWSLKDLKKPLPESGRAAVRQVLDCLKPLRFIEVRFSETKMDDYLRDYIRTCEARLAK